MKKYTLHDTYFIRIVNKLFCFVFGFEAKRKKGAPVMGAPLKMKKYCLLTLG